MHVQIDKSGCFSGKMPDEWRFQALKKLNCCKKIEMKKL